MTIFRKHPAGLIAFFTYAAVAVFLCASWVLVSRAGAQAAGSVYFSPSSGNYQIGETFTVSVREHSGTEPANVVTIKFNYPTTLLEYVSTDAAGSGFGISAAEKIEAGAVNSTRATAEPVTGDQLVQKFTFKAIASGTAALAFQGGTVVISSDDNTTDVAPAHATSSFVIAAVPISPAPPSPVTTNRPAAATTATVTITQQGSTKALEPAADGSVDVKKPVTIQPASAPAGSITKVEYYLDDKLVKTVRSEPFSYRIDPNTLVNGRHELITKTYYTDNTIGSDSQILNVNNSASARQVSLQAVKYWWAALPSLLIIAALALLWMKRRRIGAPYGTRT